ncbi:MAG: hypothetical protein Q7R41_11680 [Phycisphaerales bacterium]|nr:hypothetical protein [Phycisphaerales bacterium]
MDPAAIELVRQICEIVKVPAAKAVITKGIELFEKPLADVFPLLGKLGALRIRQLERSVQRLEDQLRRVEITQDADRMLGFANMCFRYFEAGAKEHRELKLRILAAACVHCAATENADPFDVELEIFDAVERLQEFHMAILMHLYKNHTVHKPTGKHEHVATAAFAEFQHLDPGISAENDLWVSKALLTLRDITAIRIEGGSGVVKNDSGRFAPVVEPEVIVRTGKIGLAPFGCTLLTYVRNAFDEP